jgi:Calx-beta domain
MSFGVVHGDGPTKAGGVSGRIANNVFSGADNRSSSRTVIGLEITNTNKSGTTIENNLFVNGHATRKDAALSLTVGSSRVNGSKAVGINNLSIRGNVVKGWNKVFGIDGKLRYGGSGPTGLNGLSVSGNSFSNSSPGGRSVVASGSARTVNSGFISRARSQSRSSWSGSHTGGSAVSSIKSGSSIPSNVVSSPSSGGSSSGPSVTVGDTSMTEADSGTSKATFTVRLSSRSSGTVSVRWETKGKSALVGRDYVGRNGTLTFRPGETSKTISIEVKGDRVREGTEQFALNLLGASNGRISDSQGLATIRNDD